MWTPGATKSGRTGRPGLRGCREVGHRVVGDAASCRSSRDAPTAMIALVERRVRQRGRGSLGLVAAVAGGGHDDDAGVPGLLDRVGERIDAVPLRRVGAVREVEDADVQIVVVAVLDDPVDRGDDLRDVNATVGSRDLEAYEARIGCHAAVGRCRGLVVWGGQGIVPACDEAGHEGAVAIGVQPGQVGRLGLERQIGSVDDLARSVSPSTGAMPESMRATSTPFPV